MKQTYYKTQHNGTIISAIGVEHKIKDLTFYLEKSNDYWWATESTSGVLANHKHHKTKKSLIEELNTNIELLTKILKTPTEHLKQTIKNMEKFKNEQIQ